MVHYIPLYWSAGQKLVLHIGYSYKVQLGQPDNFLLNGLVSSCIIHWWVKNVLYDDFLEGLHTGFTHITVKRDGVMDYTNSCNHDISNFE